MNPAMPIAHPAASASCFTDIAFFAINIPPKPLLAVSIKRFGGVSARENEKREKRRGFYFLFLENA
jgi:hypothetical protein